MANDSEALNRHAERNARRDPILTKLRDDIEAAHAEQHERLERAQAAHDTERKSASDDFIAAKKKLRAAADKELAKIDRDFRDIVEDAS